jgi:hypothetical protein
MKYFKNKIVVGIALMLAFVFIESRASGQTVTEINRTDAQGKSIEFFTGYNPTNATDYVYDEAGGTDTDSGWVEIKNVFDKGTLQVSIPTLGSTSITVRIEGMTTKGAGPFEIDTKTYTVATSIAEVWNVLEYADKIRVGLLVDTNGTDTVDIAGDFITKK